MPNPAFSSELPRWWAWIPVYLVFAAAGVGFENAETRLGVAVAFATVVVVGALWQIAYRRDVADRLLVIGIVALVVAVVMLAPLGGGADLIRSDSHRLVLLAPLVGGVVLGEHGLRYRDTRRRAATVTVGAHH